MNSCSIFIIEVGIVSRLELMPVLGARWASDRSHFCLSLLVSRGWEKCTHIPVSRHLCSLSSFVSLAIDSLDARARRDPSGIYVHAPRVVICFVLGLSGRCSRTADTAFTAREDADKNFAILLFMIDIEHCVLLNLQSLENETSGKIWKQLGIAYIG